MTKIDVISGFLGAGKTTLIRKLIAEVYKGEQLVLIENEFGEISVDGGFLQDAGVQISEMSSGCICCSLVGDFGKALKEVQEQFHPDRILIEPSGVGKLSDVIAAAEKAAEECGGMALNSAITVVDGSKVKVYMKNFGEFYNNQVEHAGTIVLSRTQKLTQEKLEAAVALLREKNQTAAIVITPWDELGGEQLRHAVEKEDMAKALMEEHHHHHHHDHEHHHHEHDEHCDCHEHEHHHHEHDEHCDCHEHEHHHHDEHCDCHDHEHHHEHHHDHDGHCCCGHDHHHDHAADEVFTSWGTETAKKFSRGELEKILTALDSGEYGAILRAKGILPTAEGEWLHFDYVPEEHEVRSGSAEYTGRLCVIGSELKEAELKTLFGV
ncbi:MAG: GTP-binding protein [Oscillospiraceae bacterium]|nr:GTP-binding protein [Oscillospiraceae bacterium]